MKFHTNYKCRWLILVGLLTVSSCNGINDPQPDDLETIPEQVVDLLERKFPNAQQTTIKVVEKDKLWEATYSQNAQDYYVGLDSNNVLATYKLISSNVPDSIAAAIDKLAIRGGVLSDFRQNMAGDLLGSSVYEAKYELEGTDYLLSWTSSRYRTFSMNNHSKFVYDITTRGKLPSNADTFIGSENLHSLRGKGFVNKNNIQRYLIEALDVSLYKFLFDSSGAIVFSNYDLQRSFISEKDLPGQVWNSIQTNILFQGFEFVAGSYNKNYKVSVKKGNESFDVYLDGNGVILYLFYTGF